MQRSMVRWFAIIGLLTATGCTSQLGVLVENTNYVQLHDFTGESAANATSELTGELTDELTDQLTEPVVFVEEIEVVESVLDEREVLQALGPVVGVPITVEALIGKVNGRPIFANAVLEPVEDRIRAQLRREELTQTEFADYLLVELGYEVSELVKRDLLLTEANSGISPELAYGLFAVIGQMRKDLASTQGGSHAQMRLLTQEQDGESVDSFLESNREQILIEKLYREKIWPNVTVTWRDIQRVFEKIHIEEFDSIIQVEDARVQLIREGLMKLPLEAIPAARGLIILGRIRLETDDPKIETVIEMFAEGTPFLEVAAAVDAKDGGIWSKHDLKVGGIEALGLSDIIINGLLNSEKENKLFTHKTSKSQLWIAILELKEPISVYNRDIQIAVRNQLQNEQFYLELNRFLQTIWGEHGMFEVNKMAARVAKIALQRYFQ